MSEVFDAAIAGNCGDGAGSHSSQTDVTVVATGAAVPADGEELVGVDEDAFDDGVVEVSVDVHELRNALSMILAFNATIEIRAIGCKSGRGRTFVTAGYFNSVSAAVQAVSILPRNKGVYFTINQLNPALVAVMSNHMEPAEGDTLTKDGHVTRRIVLMVDLDPVRAHAGISSTDREHDAAEALADQVMSSLAAKGWPVPIKVDSGNGFQLWYRIDLPVDDGKLVENILTALAAQYSTLEVKIDTSVHNPSRITKLPGTVARKGDHTHDRPHRVARIVGAIKSLLDLEIVPDRLLEQMAECAPNHGNTQTSSRSERGQRQIPADDVELRRQLDSDLLRWGLVTHSKAIQTGNDGAKWYTCHLEGCVFDPAHSGKDSAVSVNLTNGIRAYKCFHNSCKDYRYRDFIRQVDPTATSNHHSRPNEELSAVQLIDADRLIAENREMRPVIIEGLLRRGEVMNFVAAPKTGKSWGVLLLAVAVATGVPWLGYPCTRGRVLLIDNELHAETLAARIERIATACGVGTLRDRLTVIPLRGSPRNLLQLRGEFERIRRGAYDLVILDSLYRAYPPNFDENSNAQVTALYSTIDEYAAMIDASFVLVHHTSKGLQGAKNVTDVGSGAGAQSRAPDTHLTLRPHQEPGVLVLDAVVRSFSPVLPTCWRFEFPTFTAAADLDPTELSTGRRRSKDENPKAQNVAWTPQRFVAEFITSEGKNMDLLQAEAAPLLSAQKVLRLVKQAVALGLVEELPGKTGAKGYPKRYLVKCEDIR